ncbi:hypothetical protein FIBSPDRAFT_763696 [Athelia psychrophila]|uniref:Major facilitator superfamily (MFS) profile domain-containing protein n=1 Tax=Athelia psychrophila TaxID=1759441 RepID=A0A167X5N5_9AGAM|nr:hypothetical protein FIBSPDRAFT_763696 [Fibularhizoctonia sp. CBS 109695]
MAEKQPTDQHIETVSGANTTTDVGSRSISAIEPYDLKDHAIVQDSDVQPLPEWWVAKYLPGYSPGRMLKFKSAKTYYWAINMLAGLAILFYGYDQGVMSLVNLNEDYLTKMGIYPTTGNQRNTAALGGIVAVYYGGSLIGALFGGELADRAGRITAIMIGVIVSVIGAIFQASAQNITWMCCARVVTGLGVGAIDAVIPVWSSEVSSHQARGSFLAVEFFLNIAGLALAYWIEIFADMNTNKVMAWRTPLALQIVFLLTILILVPFFPESPRWLAKVGRVSEARTVLRATRSAEIDIEPELRSIVNNINADRTAEMENNSYWRMMFPKMVERDKGQRELRKRVVLSVWLQIMQELTGIGVVTVYAVSIMTGAGFSQQEAKLLAGFNDISYMFCVLFAVFTLDRCGRRSTMVWGAAVMALVLLLGGILDKYAQTPGPNQRMYGSAVIALVYLYTGTFGATWLVTPWLYPTELFPTFVRAKGGAWSVVGWSIGNGVITMITPFLIQAIGYGVLLLLFGLNIFVIPFIIFMYPETSGRPLEQIDTYFSNSDSWNVFTASKQVKDKGYADWQWTKKYSGSIEHDSADNAEVVGDEEKPGSAEQPGRTKQHGNGFFGQLKRKGSNAGLM